MLCSVRIVKKKSAGAVCHILLSIQYIYFSINVYLNHFQDATVYNKFHRSQSEYFQQAQDVNVISIARVLVLLVDVRSAWVNISTALALQPDRDREIEII